MSTLYLFFEFPASGPKVRGEPTIFLVQRPNKKKHARVDFIPPSGTLDLLCIFELFRLFTHYKKIIMRKIIAFKLICEVEFLLVREMHKHYSPIRHL